MRSAEEWAIECGKKHRQHSGRSLEGDLIEPTDALCLNCARAYASECLGGLVTDAKKIMALKGSYDVAVDARVQSEYGRAYVFIQKLAALRALPKDWK